MSRAASSSSSSSSTSSASAQLLQRVSFSCQSYIYDPNDQSVRLCESPPLRWDSLQVCLRTLPLLPSLRRVPVPLTLQRRCSCVRTAGKTATRRPSASSSTPPYRPRNRVFNCSTCATCAISHTPLSSGQSDRSLLYHPSSYEDVIWQADQNLLRVTMGDDTWALARNCVTKGGRLEMTCARAGSSQSSAPLMVAHVDVDREGEAPLLPSDLLLTRAARRVHRVRHRD
jgi:hypothetical protein